MINKNSSNSSGIGFVGTLQILFIALKLMGYISWSWWAVLAPSIVSASLIALFLTVIIVLGNKSK